MKVKSTVLQSISGAVAAVLLFAGVAPSLLGGGKADAAQVTVRSITMSSSKPSDTNVTYTLTLTPGTSLANPDVIVDFCDNTPLIGDTCTATAGTDVPNFTGAAAATWTVSTIGTNRGLKLTGTHTFTAATPTTITITGVTNPSNTGANGTFYARVLTYASGTAGAATSVSPGTYTDYGGLALSTTDNISITAKVFETLTFCIFQGASCAAGTAPALTLGDSTTGALSTSTAYVNSNAKYTLATNAGGGVTVAMRGKMLCTTTGTNCDNNSTQYTIDAIASTPVVSAAGTEQFGMCADKNGSAALTVAAAYTDSVNNCQSLTTGTYSGTSKFGFDNTNVINASGSTVLSSTGAVSSVSGGFAFVGNVAATTEAGVYTSNLNLVATGKF
jgi:hypothetical protein